MAPGRLSLAVLLTVGALLLHTTAGQKIHAVGDRLGWIVPPGGPVAYEVWASTQSFVIGDVLCKLSEYKCKELRHHESIRVLLNL